MAKAFRVVYIPLLCFPTMALTNRFKGSDFNLLNRNRFPQRY